MSHRMIGDIAMVLAALAKLFAELRKWWKPSHHDGDQKHLKIERSLPIVTNRNRRFEGSARITDKVCYQE